MNRICYTWPIRSDAIKTNGFQTNWLHAKLFLPAELRRIYLKIIDDMNISKFTCLWSDSFFLLFEKQTRKKRLFKWGDRFCYPESKCIDEFVYFVEYIMDIIWHRTIEEGIATQLVVVVVFAVVIWCTLSKSLIFYDILNS